MIAIPLVAPACFGIACPRHALCARYAAVDDSRADPGTMVTCTDGRRFPMFLSLAVVCTTTHRREPALAVA